jgi:hypothetical protein
MIEEEMELSRLESLRLKRLITRQSKPPCIHQGDETHFSSKAKQMDRLDKQLAPIRKTFNDRIEYVL